MIKPNRERFEFDAFSIDTAEHLLLRDSEPVPLEPKVFETLLVLIRQNGRLVGKEELMRAVWPDSFVEDSNLTRNISVLRKALSPNDGVPQYIETVPKCGYRFVGDVRALAGEGAGRADVDAVPRHNLPDQLTSFVGRDREIDEIGRLLASTRLVTLTGAGGCGKTRLALQVAVASLPRFEDGTWLVELAPLADGHLVTQSVATVLGVREGPTRSLRDSIVDAPSASAHPAGARQLRACHRCLCGAGRSAGPRCPTPSDSGDEPRRPRDFRRDGAVRATAVAAGQIESRYPQRRCWSARRRACSSSGPPPSNPSLTIDRHQVATIANICHRLDGIPLAIELAAARVNVLSVEQIDIRLEDRFRLLTGGSRTSVARHRTLEGTVEWSYDLLSEAERRVLSALSVFLGGWSLEAAEEVCSGEGVEKGEVLDLLSHLVGKSLVVVEDDGRGARRYRYLETVQQYGRGRLVGSGEVERVKNRHLGFFFDLARRAEPELMGLRQASWLKQLHLEHDNLRSALAWCLSPAQMAEQPDRALDFATALWWFWVKRGFFAEGRQWLDRAVEMAPDSPPSRRARACAALANMTYFQGDFAGTATYARNSVALGREAGDLFSVAFGLGLQTIAAAEAGDVGLALRLAGDCRAAAIASGNPWTAGPALYVLGFLAIREGDYDEASRLCEEAWNASIRDPWASSIHVSCLVGLRVVQGRYAEAHALGAEGIALCRDIEDPVRTAWSLVGIAAAHAVQGRPLNAARLWGASEGLLDSAAASLPPTHRWIRDRHIEGVRAALGDAAFRAAFSEGRAMSMRKAIQHALEASE